MSGSAALRFFLSPDIDCNQDCTEESHADDGLMGVLHDERLFFADKVADPGQNRTPHPGADKGVEGKAQMIHPGHAGRNGNQVANDRQKAADEDRNLSMPQKEAFCFRELFLGYPYIFAIFQHQGPSQPVGGKVVGIGTDKAAESTYENGDPDIHLPLMGEVAGRRHDKFTGKRNNGTFHCHQSENSRVTHCIQGVEEPVYKIVHSVILSGGL